MTTSPLENVCDSPKRAAYHPSGVASGQMPRSQPAVLSPVPAAAVAGCGRERGTERQGPGGRSVPSPDFRAATALKYAPFSASLVPVFAPTQSRRCRYCTAVNRCVPDLTITKTVPVLRDRGSSVCNVCRGGPAKMHDHSPESSVSAGEVSAVNDTSPADCRNRTPHRRIALESDVCENMT